MLDRYSSPRRCSRIAAEVARGSSYWRAVPGGPDGEIRVVREVGNPIYEKEAVIRFIGAFADITEQEQMTQELRRREAYLEQAQALSHTGSFGWNVSTGDLYWSDETHQILEYKHTVKPTLELVFKRVHPEAKP